MQKVEESYRAYRASTGPDRTRLLERYLAAARSLEQSMLNRPPLERGR